MWSLAGKRRIGVLVGDVALACLSVPIAVALRSNLALDEIPWSSLVVPSVFAGLAAILALGLSGTHLALWRFVTIRDLAALLVGATASVLGYLALMFLWDRLASVARAVPVIQWLVLVVGMCGVRVAYVALARVGRQREAIEPVSWEPVLLIGGGRGAALMVELLDLASGGSWRPVGILDERLTIGRLIDNVPILGRVGDYRRVMTGLALRGMRPQRILVTAVPDRIEPVVLHRLLSQARADGVAVTDIGSLLGLGAAHDVAVDGDGSAREAAHLELQLTSYLMTKRLFDIVVSLVVLAATAPLLALGALGVVCAPVRRVQEGSLDVAPDDR